MGRTVSFWILKERQEVRLCSFFFTKFSILGRMWEVATRRKLSNVSPSSRLLYLLLTTCIVNSGKACHSYKFTKQVNKFVKVQESNMSNCISEVRIVLRKWQLHLKFRWNSFNINVKWHWKQVFCGPILAYVLKTEVQVLWRSGSSIA